MGTEGYRIRGCPGIQVSTQKRFFHRVQFKRKIKDEDCPRISKAVIRLKGNRDCKFSGKIQRFLFETFSSKEGVVCMETSARYEESEQIPANKEVQDGVLNIHYASSLSRRLADKHRSKGCLFPCSNYSRTQKVSKVFSERSSCAVQMPTVRSFSVPKRVYKNFGDAHIGIKERGASCVSLPGRYPDSSKFKLRSRGSYCSSKRFLASPWVDNKSREEQSDSYPSPTVSRGSFSNRPKSGQSASRKARQDDQVNKTFQETGDSICATMPKGTRIHVGDHSNSEMGKMAFKALTKFPFKKGQTASLTPTGKSKSTTAGEKDPDLVVQSGESGKRNSFGRTRMGGSDHRCIKCGLGSPHRREICTRHLERKRRVFKYSGIKSHQTIPFFSVSPVKGRTGKDHDRQHDSSCLYSETGRYQKCDSDGRSKATVPVGRKLVRRVNRSTSSRERKLESRLPQPGNNRPRRVEFTQRHLWRNCGKMGTTRRRCDGIPTKQKMPSIFLKTPLQGSSGNRWFETELVKKLDLCLSTFSLNLESVEENKKRQSGSYRSNSLLAQKTLVSSSLEVSHRGTNTDSEFSRLAVAGISSDSRAKSSVLDGLAVERERLKHLSLKDEVVVFLLKSRKTSTSSQYYKVWEKFVEFVKEKDGMPLFPSPTMIVEFLFSGYEKKLHVSTLRGQVSAISALTGKAWAEEPLIKRFFNAMLRVRPMKRNCLPPWDLPFVLKILTETPFEPLERSSVWNLTLKVVFLVAITSACRVGEISALAASEPHTVIFEDRVVLKPAFGFLPKVISKFHMDLEVILPSFFPSPKSAQEKVWHTLDLVRAIRIYLERTEAWRKSERMFIVPNGYRKGQAPSKRTISSWIVAAIAKAYNVAGRRVPEGLKAHSTRALASSWAAQARESPENICKSARWSSLNTFVKHYKLDVLSSQEAKFGRKVLQSVVYSTD
ncbi:uncharacterized protein LOC121399455 [Xenopus laevis]|uniref:Uncharacterized protein LOC121399455 n=1 Tax=Xenopus laevis TaxID=8355 RepID=A0A8J1M359_XENLA|nr:uncharacterized protein LOC121399455 [Xenopus laevis]